MVLYLSESDVASLMTMHDCIRVIDEAFAEFGRGESIILPRAGHALPGKAGALRVISAILPHASFFGLKTLTGAPGRRLENETYFVILLFEMGSGALRAVISANLLTGLRTGAASAVAAKYLARQEAEVLGVFGTGPQAKYQVEAICAVRRVGLVKVFAPNGEKAGVFAKNLEGDLGISAQAVKSPREAVAGCGLVVAATTAQEPVFDGSWVEPGTHISGVGANAPAKRELDAVCFQRSRIVVDLRKQAVEEAGDLKTALETGAIHENEVGTELGEVVIGAKPGRTKDEEITLFKSVGIAIEDIAPAIFLYQRALEAGVGTILEAYRGMESLPQR